MDISIFGLGYVGAVSAACLAKEGHRIIGVDPNSIKVELINKGYSPVIEKDLDKLINAAVREGMLWATDDAQEAVLNSELSLICVGTPSQLNGNLDISNVRKVCEQIGETLATKDFYHVVVVRSTILPGSMTNAVIPSLEDASGKRAGLDFGVCNNPEFLREGTAVDDFYKPPKIVIGEIDEWSGELVTSLYKAIKAPLIRTDVKTSEMVKYTDNVWHALKIGFSNEIGNICKAIGIDSHKIMEIFCWDTKLNLSPAYLKPGFAFGGSCLPKDIRALTYKARTLDLDIPILNAVLPSNEYQIEKALKMIMAKGYRRVGILGFSFKAGTDDIRESPLIELIERLLGKGYDLKLYDRYVKLSYLMGANRDYLLNHIPHISRLMAESLEEVLDHAQTLVIGNNDEEFRGVIERLGENQTIVDLVRISEAEAQENRYDGICW